ncbi:DNA polymerase IV [Paenactinomyces guangxiensis]|uniref:DNA polymerase IV n=1 Tax=Paenactinomyces guangxiensis TaxID=1490290 RepID=A0A7W1WMR0_9BACL|nr:DNA polymerase IV [Paenactinomyces guangxiensis]MBA4492773.1 DNA polymerase IV [Paenactinomyces guangxiensis]MBH8590378.1 DNA polymerase IV [Paenactinomyces guangxiensis]
MDSVVFLIDMQSFYASIEKARRPELKNRPVVVSGDPERRSGVVLAACPIAKSYGIKNATTLWEAWQHCPHLTVVRPRMELYLQASLRITGILERFSDLVEPYSIDEQFLSVKGSEKLFGEPEEMAKKIQDAIRTEMDIYGRIGIGPNKVLSKMACDNFAKKNKTGIFQLTRDNMKKYLWPLPVDRMFGVGRRMSRHLQRMGIRTIGELACFPLERLKKRWGVNGHILWLTANGIDTSPVTRESFSQQKAIGHHMTLPRDYRTPEEIRVILLELCEEVCRRTRSHHLMGQTVTVGCRGASFEFPSGFHRQMKMPDPTNQTMEVFQHAWKLFDKFWDEQPIRSLGVSLSQLQRDDTVQLSLFADRDKEMQLGYVMDEIKQRFGATAILRASSLTPAGQAIERSRKIGGHYK